MKQPRELEGKPEFICGPHINLLRSFGLINSQSLSLPQRVNPSSPEMFKSDQRCSGEKHRCYNTNHITSLRPIFPFLWSSPVSPWRLLQPPVSPEPGFSQLLGSRVNSSETLNDIEDPGTQQRCLNQNEEESQKHKGREGNTEFILGRGCAKCSRGWENCCKD